MAKLFGVSVDRYIAADIESAPFPDNYFDTVFSCSVLHHISSPSRALAEIYRILKPGGVYLGTGEPMATKFLQFFIAITKAMPSKTRYGAPEKIYTFTEWRGLFRTVNFRQMHILVSKNPANKHGVLSTSYTWVISKVPDFVIRRLLGSGIYIIAKKDN